MTKRLLFSIAQALFCLTVSGQTEGGFLHLFPEEMKSEVQSPEVFSFLERYLYEVHTTAHGYDFFQKMADEKVVVREGSLNNIPRLGPDVPFSITRYEDKGYEAYWTDTTGVVLLSLQFPINYELLLGKPKVDIEKEFRADIEAMPDEFVPLRPTPELVPSDSLTDVLVPAHAEFYYAESLNTSTYYTVAEGDTIPVFSPDEKWSAAANLFHGVIEDCGTYKLHFTQQMYGFVQQTFMVSLTQWFNYCRANKLTVYFGIEEERTDGLKALLIARNVDLGYNHMLSIVIPDDFVLRRDCVLKAMLNAYIPTNNVKQLYSEQNKHQEK